MQDVRRLVVLSVVARILAFGLVFVCSSHLPLFDSSPEIITRTPLLRWDVFHFANIAENGYQFEHEWAFFPGTPIIMRVAAVVLSGANSTVKWDDLLLGGALVALACDTTCTLYHLSLHHLRSPSLALLASCLSLLPSSPATLRFAPYGEPFFTYLSYRGMLFCARSRWLAASICFALAGLFRSNGILLSGFILWGLIIQPLLDGKKLSINFFLYSIILTAITFAPFIYHNVAAYRKFCSLSDPKLWCSNLPPSIYTHVQSTYWNVGFLRYWTLQQLPNFLISAPPAISLFYFCLRYIRYALVPQLLQKFNSNETRENPQKFQPRSNPFLSPSLAPHVIHALFLCTALLFNSHTQIILRLGASMPTIYWAAAWMMVERPFWGRSWVAWSVVWGAVSLVLWATFLPPA